MAVYVDDHYAPFREMRMCHMFADTVEELHVFAQAIGLRKEWLHDSPNLPHYDVCLSKRRQAVKAGAVEVSVKQTVEMGRKHRREKRK